MIRAYTPHVRAGLGLALLLFLAAACSTTPDVVPGPATPRPTPGPTPTPAPTPRPTPQAVSIPPEAAFWAPLIQKLNADGLDGRVLIALFSRPEAAFDPEPMTTKLNSLYKLLFKSDLVRSIQRGLIRLGYTPGTADGKCGGNTRRAIKAFQEVHGTVQDGEPTKELLRMVETDLALPPEQRPEPVNTMTQGQSHPAVYKSLLTDAMLDKARAFYRANQGALQLMQERYGVSPEVVVGILTVETRLGEYLGNRKVFPTLASMALARDFTVVEPHMPRTDYDQAERLFFMEKAREKGDWAYTELRALILHTQANGQDPFSVPGSIYGAIGLCQFMPSNALTLGVDGDGDGRVNLFTMGDAIMSIGNYLRHHGWKGDMSNRARQREVVYTYNHSNTYVNTVLAVADAVGE